MVKEMEKNILWKKNKAEILFKNNIKTFIKDVYDNFHFCHIKEINSDWLIVKGFKGNRNGEIIRIFWIDIVDIQEYKEDLK